MSKLSIFLLIFGFVSVTFGQQIHSHMSTMGSLADTKNGKYSSIDLGFSIDLPDSPHGSSGVGIRKRSWRLKEGHYMVGTSLDKRDIENADDFEQATEALAEAFYQDFVRDYFKTKGEVLTREKKAAVYAGRRGMEFRLSTSGTNCLIRVSWVKNRAYLSGVLLIGPQRSFEQAAIKVFDSIKVFTPDEIASIIAIKVRESTPLPLPQSPVVKKLRSDAQDVNLKGKVKEVFEDIEHTSGRQANSGRQKMLETFYNEAGNRVRKTRYDEATGLPEELTVYGYMKGFRVSSRDRVELGERMPRIAIYPPIVIKDPGYDTKYTYKYDAKGTLIEEVEQFIFYTTRKVIKHTGTIAEITYYSGPKINGRLSVKYDEKGNEIEIVMPDSNMKGFKHKYMYEYLEFDAQGNWIKRLEKKASGFEGRLLEDWAATQYRTITYHQ